MSERAILVDVSLMLGPSYHSILCVPYPPICSKIVRINTAKIWTFKVLLFSPSFYRYK